MKVYLSIPPTVPEDFIFYIFLLQMTWADLAIVPLFSAIERTQVEVDLSIFPKLTSLRQKIESIPEVKKYLSSKNKL